MPRNIRAPQMWEIIKPHANWHGKKVVDLGCGYGDMCKYAYHNKADVTGIDSNEEIVAKLPMYIKGLVADIEDYVWDIDRDGFDIGFCFSVLPYLHDQVAFMLNVGEAIPLLFIETQMMGDGPGTMTKGEIKAMLRNHYMNVEEIGHTVVEYRNAERPIWKCYD